MIWITGIVGFLLGCVVTEILWRAVADQMMRLINDQHTSINEQRAVIDRCYTTLVKTIKDRR